MKRTGSRLRVQIAALVALSLGLIWAATFYELYRSHQANLHEAGVRTAVQAQVFAEYSRSTLKRVNEFILGLRPHWTGDWQSFSQRVRTMQENIDDISFQVSVIDRDGMLAFSTLATPNDRTDLSQREHFRVHKDSPNADSLFISRPVKGKISGKWSIQFTRPLITRGKFAGIVVVSLSPEQFAGFAQKLGLRGNSVTAVIRDSGEIMARYPADESSLGKVISNRPYLEADAPLAGNFRQTAATDGIERIFGYYKLPDYGLTFVRAEAIDDILAPYAALRTTILVAATAVSILAIALVLLLLRSLTELEVARRQLDAIFALSPDGFVSFDADHRVKYASPTFKRLTGLDETDVAGLDENAFGERLAQLCASHGRFQGMQALRSAAHISQGDEGERRQLIELAGAGKRVLEVGIRVSTGGAVSQILFLRDVTHETEVERIKSEFLSTAAHELRSPMASIFGYSELMLAQDFGEEDRREFLGIIHRQSALIVSIINELLDLSRIEARRGKDFSFARVDAAELLRQALANFKLPEGFASLLAPSEQGRHWVRADAGKLMQAVSNVLSNACKYSPDGGTIELELIDGEHDGLTGLVGLRISDHGIGMTPAQLDRIFERFYRADASGNIPGTGLGMSIVKEIVELHGGSVALASDEGRGTTVTLWIPAA
jgi:signal transduction histidine kinase